MNSSTVGNELSSGSCGGGDGVAVAEEHDEDCDEGAGSHAMTLCAAAAR